MSIESDGSRKIVVLIDADNAQVGKLSAIMNEIAKYGHIIVKKAYGDWSGENLKRWKDNINSLAIQAVQQFAYTAKKNSTDMAMAIDAMDLLYKGRFDTFVLVSSDSDFTALAQRLRASEIYVYGVGEKKTPKAFRNACDEFILTEKLSNVPIKTRDGDGDKVIETDTNDKMNAVESKFKQTLQSMSKYIIPFLNDACETCVDKNGWTSVAKVGYYIKQHIPNFNSKDFGHPKLTDLIKSLDNFYEFKKEKKDSKGTAVAYIKKVKS
jgi:hypothetical protein